MKCFVENFLELDIDELLAVNGGYGSSSRNGSGSGSGDGGGSGSGSYGAVTSNSREQTSWDVWVANKDGRNSSGEITRPHDPYRDSPRNSGNYDAPSFVPDNSMTGGGGKEEEVTPSTFEQRDFSDEYGENFGDNACAATSLLNEISEEYTEQTGEQLTKEQAEDAMSAAVEGGYIDSNDAFVKDWEGAADEMWKSTGQDGDFVYNESEDADHVIYAQDTKGGPGVDHFVNSSGPDQYYDPWTGETCDLDPTVLQKDRPVRGLDFVE